MVEEEIIVSQFLLYIILFICIISLFIVSLIRYATKNYGIRRLLYSLMVLADIYAMYRIHSLWNVPVWGQWVLSFGLPLAFMAAIILVVMILDVIINRQLSAITFDVQKILEHIRHFIPNLKQDFWSFTQFCVVDENDPATQHLFDHLSFNYDKK